MSYIKIHPTDSDNGRVKSYKDQNRFLNQALNLFISGVKFTIVTWALMGTDSLSEQPQAVIEGTAVFGTPASLPEGSACL